MAARKGEALRTLIVAADSAPFCRVRHDCAGRGTTRRIARIVPTASPKTPPRLGRALLETLNIPPVRGTPRIAYMPGRWGASNADLAGDSQLPHIRLSDGMKGRPTREPNECASVPCVTVSWRIH